MSTGTWHATDETLHGYARGEAGIAVMASVEAHLLHCADCRQRIAAVNGEPLEAAWTGVLDRIHEPRPPLVVRVLRRCGLSEADGVLLTAARSLTGAWLLATLAVVIFAAVASIPSDRAGKALYLLVAPVVPVAGIVAAFASTDALAALVGTTPYSKARLALLRTLAVVVTSVPLVIVVGLAIPGIAPLAFAWLLPALALTLVALVGLTWWRAEPVGLGVALAWVLVLSVARDGRDLASAVSPPLQLVYLAVAVVAALSLAWRIGAAHTPGGSA